MPDDGDFREHEPDVELSDYNRAQDDYHAERMRLGKHLMAHPRELLDQLTRDPMSLRDRVGLTVRWGVAMQLVHFSGDGLAHAHQDFQQVDPEVLADFAGDIYEGLDPNSEEYADVDLEWHYEMHGEPLFETHQELRAFMDLQYALQTGYGQSVAIAARLAESGTDSDMPEMQPMRCSDTAVFHALDLLPGIALIAEEDTSEGIGPVPKTRSIPKRIYDEFLELVELHRQKDSGSNQELWFYELLECFQRGLCGQTAEQVVSFTLWELNVMNHCPVPNALKQPTEEHRQEAIRFIRTHRIDTSDFDDPDDGTKMAAPSYEPEDPQRGPALRPWTAAVRFARCFGVTNIPEREKDAKRLKMLRLVK